MELGESLVKGRLASHFWRDSCNARLHKALRQCLPPLRDSQDPTAADKLAKIQKDLDETKIILHKTIESVLDRGEKLDQVGRDASMRF